MDNMSILEENQAKAIEIEKVKQLENVMTKELIDHDLKPKSNDFIFNDCSYEYKNGNYKIRDEPLFMFKRKSKFRQWAEKRLKENNLENYTVIYKFSKEWFDSILLVSKSTYEDVL